MLKIRVSKCRQSFNCFRKLSACNQSVFANLRILAGMSRFSVNGNLKAISASESDCHIIISTFRHDCIVCTDSFFHKLIGSLGKSLFVRNEASNY